MNDLDLRAQLSLSLGSGYIMDRELATGGRSRLFVARELTHDRDVVVKVIPEDVAAGVSQERFAREIHLISVLNEPHTVPILTTGCTANGVMYYTMPYIAEPSLGRRLEEAPVAFDDSVNALRDLARAMLHAHRQGIVHGDIKPENVFLLKGTAVVTDFGVAVALDASRSDENERGRLRLVTSSVRAPGYVAPEHVSASPEADHRADIYAWGVMAYELFYDVHPFPYVNTVGELLEAHKNAPPAIPPYKAFGVPEQLATLVMRCLAKDPDERPADASELLGVLDRIPSGAAALAVESWSPYRLIGMALLAFVAFLGLAGAIWRLRSVGTSEAPLVAVLPFDASGPVGDSLLGDAVLRGVIAKLEQISDIRVVDVASTHSLPHTAADAWATGKVLGAQYVLQTSMHWFRDQDGSVRAQISPMLLQVSDGKIRRAGEPQLVFPSDPFTPASSIATLAARELNVAIHKSQKAILAGRGTNDTAAYAAFARGDALYWRGMELQPEVASEALTYFERAFTLDPRYAEALGSWASVAASRARAHASPEMLDSISRVARRAQAILPNNARALIAVGRVALLRNQQDDALAAAFRAAGANASVTEAYELLAQVHLLMGDSAAVWHDVERLVRIAPRSPNSLESAAMTAMALRRFGDAREYLRRARAIQPSRPDLVLRAAELARQVGNVTEMIRLVHEARTLGAVLRAEDLALLRMGDQNMQSELASSSPETYDTRTAADSFHYYMEKSKLFLAHRDARLARTLDGAQAALKSVLASRSTSELDRRMFTESQGWIDAASGDHARVQAAMNDVPSSMNVQRYPNGSFAAFVSCNDAEIDALGGDVERMLPHLVRCLTLPGGYGMNAILDEPALARHARDPRLAAMLGRIGLGLDRD